MQTLRLEFTFDQIVVLLWAFRICSHAVKQNKGTNTEENYLVTVVNWSWIT